MVPSDLITLESKKVYSFSKRVKLVHPYFYLFKATPNRAYLLWISFKQRRTCDWLPCICWSAQHVYFLKPKFAAESADGLETTVPGVSVGLLGGGDI